MKKIIHCKTEELYNKVLQKLEDETDLKWPSGRKPTEFDCWCVNKEETNLCVGEDIFYQHIDYFKVSEIYNDYDFITAEEFLGEESKPIFNREKFTEDFREYTKVINKINNKPMLKELTRQIKKIIKSKDDQKLYRAGIINEYCELVETDLFLKALYETKGNFEKAREILIEEADDRIKRAEDK